MDKRKSTLLLLIMIFTFFGIVEAGMLTLAKYSDSVALLCGEDIDNSCNTVQSSPYANILTLENEAGVETFKFPITLAGVFFYGFLFILTCIYYRRVKKKKKVDSRVRYVLFGVGVIGVIFSAVFTWIQAYLIEAFCTYCVISAINTVVILILISMLTFRKK